MLIICGAPLWGASKAPPQILANLICETPICYAHRGVYKQRHQML